MNESADTTPDVRLTALATVEPPALVVSMNTARLLAGYTCRLVMSVSGTAPLSVSRVALPDVSVAADHGDTFMGTV